MSDDPLPLSTDFEGEPGQLATLSPLVRRLTAPNPGPMTFKGTNTYVVGHGEVTVIDPGPALPEHVAALLAALRGERVANILVTHTHRDHSPAARLLAAETGAPILGCAPHHPFRPPYADEATGAAAGNDLEHVPDRVLADGEAIEGDGFTLQAIATPGHTMNHLAFALPQERALFSGDHVMAWSTTVVAPPGGSMAAYMASLDKLRSRDDAIYWPGHGGPVRDPARFVRALQHHRRQRERAILARLRAGDTTIEAIVAATYEGLDPRLARAAGVSVLAHLEDLVARGRVVAQGGGLAARFTAADTAERPEVRTHLEAIRAAFGDLGGLALLDVGCGDSRLPAELAALGAHCTGIDPFMPARDWQAEGAGRWRILQSAAESLPFADASIDGVLFVYSLHHVPAAAQAGALAEARRVLKPGGRLVVAEPLAEGDFNDIIKLFHDEARVRGEAQATLAAASRLFEHHATSRYLSRRHFEDFAAFATMMQANTRFNDYAAEAVVVPAVRARFEAIAARTGGIFDQPVKLDVLS